MNFDLKFPENNCNFILSFGEIQALHGKDGVSIVAIERTSGTGAAGTIDTYTVYLSNDEQTEFKVYNGADGYTPIKGVDYFDGQDGYTPQKDVDYFDGKDGEDGYTPQKGVDYWTSEEQREVADAIGAANAAASAANDTANEIRNARDSGEFNGKDGEDGYTPQKGVDYFDGYTPQKNVDYFDGEKGDTGVSIQSIERTAGTGEAGTTDTYTITLTNGNTATFSVYNGKDGEKGDSGYTPQKGVDYFDGEKGDPGTGVTILGSFDTEAELRAAHPTSEPGDAYMVSGDLYVWSEEKSDWENVGRIKGEAGQDGYTPQKGIDYFDGENGDDGVSVTHSWDGTTLIVTSASGTSSADLKGDKGDDGHTPVKGVDYFDGERGDDGYTPVKGKDYFDGEDGYTPQKGVDYWTAEEQKEITDAINAANTAADGANSAAEEANNAANEIRQARANGEFNGKDGEDGKDGYTPVKGVDYFDGQNGSNGKDGVAATHSWNGTVLSITSASGTSSADLKGEKGDDGYTPVKGKDYFDGNDGQDGQDGYTPQKGVDYFDGKDGKNGENGKDGQNGVSATHSWNGTVLTVTSASGSSSADLKGAKGDPYILNDTDKNAIAAAVKASLNTENWTFTLEDGTEVTKAVYIG